MIASPDNSSLVFLDNQALRVTIEIPTGRFSVLDTVSGIEWQMGAPTGAGSIRVNETGRSRALVLGSPDRGAVPFESNYYMVRSNTEDDLHDVLLSGTIPVFGCSVTIRYLLSFAEPVLDCFCYVDDDYTSILERIDFPMGLVPSTDEPARVCLPDSVKDLAESQDQGQLWQPDPTVPHAVAGTPFFALQARTGSRESTCIGLLQHPRCAVRIEPGETHPLATPYSTHLETTGKSEEQPYHFRYRIVPTTDEEAILWLCREELLSPEQPLVL